MSAPTPAPLYRSEHSWRAKTAFFLTTVQIVCQCVGFPAVVLAYGFEDPPIFTSFQVRTLVVALAVLLTAVPVIEWRLSPARRSYAATYAAHFIAVVITLVGALAAVVFFGGRGLLVWCDLTVLTWVALAFASLLRHLTLTGWNPALIFVLSFLGLIAIGTVLLMLPRSQAQGQPTDFHTSLFTATSAVCVTGLIVVDTGTHWSREGQIILLVLIQLGGLGLMTCGAVFALMVRRGLRMRESAVLGDLLERDVLADLRRLLLTIVLFTLSVELIGAVLLSDLWSHLPLGNQIFHSTFHSVSAFCNAGFSLQSDSMTGFAQRWQTVGIMPVLIIVGGLGFVVIYDIGSVAVARLSRRGARRRSLFFQQHERIQFCLTTRIVLWATFLLLTLGVVGTYVLEGSWNGTGRTSGREWTAAWFHSVSSRTAGFNTVSQADLKAGTKLFTIALMLIGASPGSTGGGLKTVPVVICILTIVAFARGRSRVEIGGRAVPGRLVSRALTIVALGFATWFTLTLIVTAIENQPGQFLDHLFEVTSALATVGLSTGATTQLCAASQTVLIVAMFLGRVGPLTLIVALAARSAAAPRYEYPEERVLLG